MCDAKSISFFDDQMAGRSIAREVAQGRWSDRVIVGKGGEKGFWQVRE
jgi:hypothetical protein